jgi:glutamyl-Q tRNA(Asp) synthetase
MAKPYVGRFAPSPTGSLHLGSLLAAVGSYLDARAHQGQWRVRIEDIDTSRVVPGSADSILRALEAFGLQWDGPVEYQSRHVDRYAQALEHLRSRNLIFECSCSRREQAGTDEGGYPGTCREGPRRAGPTAARFRVDESKPLRFLDRIQGECCFELKALGDVAVRRRDGLFAYQLAVVVDDAEQRITDIVRGADLLPSTAWQMEIRGALNLPEIRHAHLPLVVEPDGAKLAKSKRSVPVDLTQAGALMHSVLRLLRQEPPSELAGSGADALAWAIAHWNPAKLHAVREVRLL